MNLMVGCVISAAAMRKLRNLPVRVMCYAALEAETVRKDICQSWIVGSRVVFELLCLGSVYFLRLAPISLRRGSAQQFPPSRGVMGATSVASSGRTLATACCVPRTVGSVAATSFRPRTRAFVTLNAQARDLRLQARIANFHTAAVRTAVPAPPNSANRQWSRRFSRPRRCL